MSKNKVTFKPTLENFLKEKKAKRKFIRAIEEDPEPTDKLIERANIRKGEKCFANVIIFSHTREGHDFWQKLAIEFQSVDY